MPATILGTGVYSTAEAAMLLGLPARKTRRWVVGYDYSRAGTVRHQIPLWHTQLPSHNGYSEIGFLDLMQLRTVARLLELGFSMHFIRRSVRYAADVLRSEHPFVTSKFRTDGRSIFLELAEMLDEREEPKLLDLRNRQWVMREIIDRTFV